MASTSDLQRLTPHYEPQLADWCPREDYGLAINAYSCTEYATKVLALMQDRHHWPRYSLFLLRLRNPVECARTGDAANPAGPGRHWAVE
jgi:hypothetical protein